MQRRQTQREQPFIDYIGQKQFKIKEAQRLVEEENQKRIKRGLKPIQTEEEKAAEKKKEQEEQEKKDGKKKGDKKARATMNDSTTASEKFDYMDGGEVDLN